MALTAAQKHAVTFHLGYSGKCLIERSVDYNKTIVQALDALNEYVEAQIDQLLTDIEDVQEKIRASTSRMMAVEVGDIKLAENEREKLVAAKRSFLRNLSTLVDLPVVGGNGLNIGVMV